MLPEREASGDTNKNSNMITDLTKGPVADQLRKQATPMAVALLAIISFDAVDLFFVAQLGDVPLAAISFCFPVIWLLQGIAIGFEAGVASCVSRAFGANNHALAARLTTDTALLAGMTALLICIVGLASIDVLFGLLGATGAVMPLIHDYMGIWYWIEPVAIIMWTSLASIRARGNTLLESKMIISAAAINLVLDPLLIFGWLGFPRLEIKGAALASLIANLIMLAFTLIYLHKRLRVYANPFARLQVIVDSWRRVLAVGVPAMVTNAIIPVANGIVVAMIALYGLNAVAGFGIAMRIEPLALIPFYALSAISSPFAGQNFAARRFDRILEARRVITRFCLLFGVIEGLVLILLARPVSGLFSDSEAIRSVAVDYLWIVALSYGGYGLVMAVNANFNGTGRPMPAVMLSAARVVLLFIPLALLGRWLFGLSGLFAASTASNLIVALIAFLWLGKHIDGMGRA